MQHPPRQVWHLRRSVGNKSCGQGARAATALRSARFAGQSNSLGDEAESPARQSPVYTVTMASIIPAAVALSSRLRRRVPAGTEHGVFWPPGWSNFRHRESGGRWERQSGRQTRGRSEEAERGERDLGRQSGREEEMKVAGGKETGETEARERRAGGEAGVNFLSPAATAGVSAKQHPTRRDVLRNFSHRPIASSGYVPQHAPALRGVVPLVTSRDGRPDPLEV